MLRRFASFGVVTLAVTCLALRAHGGEPQPPTAPQAASGAPAPRPTPVPTAKRVVTTEPPAPPPAPVPTPLVTAPNSVEKARQGVVVLERQGKPLALGVVLEGDGRILSALSPLTNGNFLSARYADGAVVPLKLVHSDRGWDLALLLPTSSAAQPLRKAGARAAKTPSFVGLQTFALNGRNIAAAPQSLQLSAGLLGADATSLTGAYDLGTKPALVGGPVVNPEGEVVALVARACPAKSTAACVPAPYGAPVSALKQFLQRVPAEATWLGVQASAAERGDVRGVRVISVTSGSPAAVAGVRPGADPQADLIVAVDGTPVTSPAELNEAVRARTTGDNVELLIFGLGRYRHVQIKPQAAPPVTAPPYVPPKAVKVPPRTPNPYR